MVQQSLIILGSGYTSRFLFPLASSHYTYVYATSRNPDKNLGHIPPGRQIRFDLAGHDTWAHIPAGADLIWCFPPRPLEQVRAFAKRLGAPPRRLVVLGSTSAYKQSSDSSQYPPPWIDESLPVDLTKPRVQGEEYLRHEHGAIVLRVAGIYGPDRNPLEWIRTRLVASSRKYVNLIHVEDLAAICLVALKNGTPGKVYNVSDGTPRRWDDICRVAQERWGVTAHRNGAHNQAGKRIKTAALRDRLGAVIRHPDLYAELEQLEESPR